MQHGSHPVNISFIPSPDVALVIHTLLDILERRAQQDARSPAQVTQRKPRSVKLSFAELSLPAYFSQTDPTPRLSANEQFILLEKADLIRLTWIPGETGHLLQSIALATPFAGDAEYVGAESVARLYSLLSRTPLSTSRFRLETLLLGEKFRFPETDWRQLAIRFILRQLKAERSPTPFSLTDSGLSLDLLSVLAALSTLNTETPYRVFSVRVFNDSKRLEAIKNQLVSLARLGNPEWKRLSAEEVLRELNLVPNPNYIHLSGNWQLGLEGGEILSIGGFFPSVGFPAAQTVNLRSVTIHADAILCIENLTTFHEFIRVQTGRYAVLCTYGNPSPAVRRLLRLVPDETPIFHWSDLDYGGFNILSQLRRLVRERIEPYSMDAATLDANFERSRPLTAADRSNLKKLLIRPELHDVRREIEYLLKRGLKLEQEGVEI